MTCGAVLNTAPTRDVPWHIDAIFITVSKVSYIFHQVPDRLTAITQPHRLWLLSLFIFVKTVAEQKQGIIFHITLK